MKETILEKILEAKKRRVDDAKRSLDIDLLRERACAVRSAKEPNRFRAGLIQSRINIIAEFKRASPSKGIINDSLDPAAVAEAYKSGGAAAISVLTEEDFFKGSLDDLIVVRAAVDLPILRKDFIFDAFQIYEAAEAGADAILLIAAMLSDDQISELRNVAEDELGLDALVEIHTSNELDRVKQIGGTLIGVNNRDLQTFNVSLDVSRNLIINAPDGAVMVTESGLRTRDDLIELREFGYSGFLIGEALMSNTNPEKELRDLVADNTND